MAVGEVKAAGAATEVEVVGPTDPQDLPGDGKYIE
jgi:hypothetical protein